MNAKDPAKIRTLIERFDPTSGAYGFSIRIIKDYTREQLLEVVQKLPLPPDSMDLFPARITTAEVIYWREPRDKDVTSCLTNKIGRQPHYRVGIASLSDYLPIDKKAFSKLNKEKGLDFTNPSYFDEPTSLLDMLFSGGSIAIILFFFWFTMVGGLTNPALITVLISLFITESIVFGNGVWRMIQAYRGEKIQEIRLEIPYLDDFKTRDLSPRILLAFFTGILVIITFLGAWILQNVPRPPPGFQNITPENLLLYSSSFGVVGILSVIRMGLDMRKDPPANSSIRTKTQEKNSGDAY